MAPGTASSMRRLKASRVLAAEARATPGSTAWLTRFIDSNTGSTIVVVAVAGVPTATVPVVATAVSLTTRVSRGSTTLSSAV